MRRCSNWTRLVRFMPWLVLGLCLPPGAAAQDVRSLEGRVVGPDGEAVVGATVALEGVGFRFTDEDGSFRFAAVPPRAYALRAEALGYEPSLVTLQIDDDDVSLTVTLDPSPIQLDSIVVESRTVKVEGRVWDPVADAPVAEADVTSDQADPTRTSWGGRFDLTAGEGTDVRILIRAFRYLPLDTAVVATRGVDHRFEMRTDSLVLRMIETEVARLQDRMGGRRAIGMGPFNREDLVRWGGATLGDLVKGEFVGRRLKCIILDELDVGAPMFGPTLETMLVDDIERIEFLFRGAMMRIYTKKFMRTMLGSGIELRRPVYSDMAVPPLCL